MSEKCLYCEIPIEQKEGKRERKFCSPSHCTLFHLKEKNKDKPKGNRGRPKGTKNKVKDSKGFTKEEMEYVEKINKFLDTPEIKEDMKQSFKDLTTKNISITKTELVDDKVKVTNVLREKPQMPKGLSLSEQLEWRENNLKK